MNLLIVHRLSTNSMDLDMMTQYWKVKSQKFDIEITDSLSQQIALLIQSISLNLQLNGPILSVLYTTWYSL